MVQNSHSGTQLTGSSGRDRMLLAHGRVAQRQSSGLLSHWLQVRILSRSLTPFAGGFII
jgi:hypothetical protein